MEIAVIRTNAFEFGELYFAVDAQRFPGSAWLRRVNWCAVGDRAGDDVGQIIFTLCVVVGD